jgi:hypothetical protein
VTNTVAVVKRDAGSVERLNEAGERLPGQR